MAKGKYQEWLTDESLLKLEAWARDGITDEQIASNMGIGKTTFYRWKKDNREIRESLKRGKEVIDVQVENALLKRALGYDYVEETQERRLNKDTGQYEFVKTKEVTKHVQGDTTAQIFWLKNRKPEVWRDKKEIGVDNKMCELSDLSDEELNPQAVTKVLARVVHMVSNGTIDTKSANTIILACNAILSGIRTDEQEKKINELEELLIKHKNKVPYE